MDYRGYTIIQDWMLDLPLSYREIAVYAIIYGFSQDGETRFEGSLAYIARKTKSSRDTARNALRRLMEENLIERTIVNKNGVEFHTYRANPVGGGKIQGGMEKFNEGGGKIQPNNKEDNKDIYTLSNKRGGFVPPTIEQVQAYCTERGNRVNADAFIAFYESNGWKVGKNAMKDWKAAVRTWEQRDNAKPQGNTARQEKKSNLARINEMMAQVMGGYADEQ